MEKYYVLASTGRMGSLIGTNTGNAFRSQKSADAAQRKLSKMAPTAQFIVLSVMPLSEAVEVWGR